MKIRYILLFAWAIVFPFTNAFPQESAKRKISSLFSQSRKAYDGVPVFEMKSSYSLFSDYKSTKPIEHYEGIYIKNKKESYSKIDRNEMVILKDISIRTDNDSKLIKYWKKGKNDDHVVYDLNDYLANFSKFLISEESGNWICTMTAPAISAVPYGKVVIYIDKNSHLITRQEIYMLTAKTIKGAKGKEKTDYPRLVISFSGFKPGNLTAAAKFNSSYYIQTLPSGTKPSKNYKNFQIAD
jgi:hypothetical protein